MIEIPLTFNCQNQTLIGVLHKPDGDDLITSPGVLIVVGGPQYRVGSHRQFVLLARSLCQRGIPVLRFDYRGMGDSAGDAQIFENINEDIKAALQEFAHQMPMVNQFVIWGLCDAASAALFYAYTDKRITGLVLLNPWVRTEAGRAKAYLKNYYLERFFSRDLWHKLFSGQFDFGASVHSFIDMVIKSVSSKKSGTSTQQTDIKIAPDAPLPEKMAACFSHFHGHVMVILSGNNDYVADEFTAVVKASPQWQSVMARPTTTTHYFAEANHTFSRQDWREQVENWTHDWVKSLVDQH